MITNENKLEEKLREIQMALQKMERNQQHKTLHYHAAKMKEAAENLCASHQAGMKEVTDALRQLEGEKDLREQVHHNVLEDACNRVKTLVEESERTTNTLSDVKSILADVYSFCELNKQFFSVINETCTNNETAVKKVLEYVTQMREMAQMQKDVHKLKQQEDADSMRAVVRDELQKMQKARSTRTRSHTRVAELSEENGRLKAEVQRLQEERETTMRELQRLKGTSLRELNKDLRQHKPVPFFPLSSFRNITMPLINNTD